MILKEIDLENLNRDEYIELINIILKYYYIQWGDKIKIVDEKKKEEKI